MLKFFVTILVLASGMVQSQELNEADLEALYQNDLNRSQQQNIPAVEEAAKDVPKSLLDLQKLAPFEDIAVIQRRFLPKTQRFEFYPNIGIIANNAYFMNAYFQGRLGYAFTEKWAVELIGAVFSSSEYRVTKDLKDKTVKTENLINPENYFGLDLRWTPFYGKMGFFTDSIIPFDMYFSLGLGVTGTNEESPATLHLGTGQIYALEKWMAFRWDVSMYYYSTASSVGQAGGTKKEETFTDVQISLGVSFFFPEASYR